MNTRMAERIDNKVIKLVIGLLKGALIGVVFSTIAVLIFALIIKGGNISEGVIPVVNQIIKIIAIFVSAWFAVSAILEKGWLFGAIAGLLFVLIGFALFSIIDGSLSPAGSLFGDILTGLIAGAVSGMLTIYIRKR